MHIITENHFRQVSKSPCDVFTKPWWGLPAGNPGARRRDVICATKFGPLLCEFQWLPCGENGEPPSSAIFGTGKLR